MKQNYKTIPHKKIARFAMFLFGLMLWNLTTQAQIVLNSSGGTTTGNYTTLKAAIDNINNGTHTGSVLIEVHGNTNEAAAINLVESGNIAGASYTSILVRPADTATTVKSITTTSTGITLLTLNGADNVTFDGRPLSTGTSKLLTLSNPANVAASHTIALTNNATSNVFTYLNIENGAIGATASTALRLLTGQNTANILNNTINGGNLGIDVAGTTGAANGTINIMNNLLTNQKATAIRLFSGVGDVNIDSNDCTHSIATTTGGYQFVNIAIIEPTATVNITKNRVYNLNTAAGNFLQGIIFSPTIASGTLVVRNNSIAIGSAAFPNTLSQIIRCLLFGGTASATVVVEHNTFRIGGTHVTLNGNPTTCGILKSNSSALTSFTCRNNISLNTRTG
ncbi:MAG: hypothetical protein ACK44D_10195, partial [Bacteroidia bacterium]